MALLETLADAAAYVSRRLGFETVDAFPPGHAYARTRWDRAYFDIASDVKPEQIERRLCEAIANTPLVFGKIENPTPRMQRALMEAIAVRMRRSCSAPADLVGLLIAAFASPYTLEAMPGLRAAIEETALLEPGERVRSVLAFMARMPSAFDVIDLN